MPAPEGNQISVWTLGHGTRPLDEFVALLRGHGIRQIADVRSIPRSRRNPQFNRETFGRFLRGRRIGYRHLKALGGWRQARADSPNQGWRNASFRGFADYMQTPDFEAGLEQLIVMANQKPTAILCAESVPWRCHRNLIADALTARRIQVFHIYGPARAPAHILNPMAQVNGARVVYPGPREGGNG